jgi:hypothetical protein
LANTDLRLVRPRALTYFIFRALGSTILFALGFKTSFGDESIERAAVAEGSYRAPTQLLTCRMERSGGSFGRVVHAVAGTRPTGPATDSASCLCLP